jgi:hypothetical protein
MDGVYPPIGISAVYYYTPLPGLRRGVAQGQSSLDKFLLHQVDVMDALAHMYQAHKYKWVSTMFCRLHKQ